MQAGPPVQASGKDQGNGPGGADRPPGRPVYPGGGGLLAFPDHQLWGRGQPMGIGGYEGNAGGSASGPECRAYAGGSEAEILRPFSFPLHSIFCKLSQDSRPVVFIPTALLSKKAQNNV